MEVVLGTVVVVGTVMEAVGGFILIANQRLFALNLRNGQNLNKANQ